MAGDRSRRRFRSHFEHRPETTGLTREGVWSAIGLVDFGDDEALVMHDLSDRLFPPGAWLDHGDVVRVLSRLAAFHDHASSLDLPPLCTIADRSNMCNPDVHVGDQGRHDQS